MCICILIFESSRLFLAFGFTAKHQELLSAERIKGPPGSRMYGPPLRPDHFLPISGTVKAIISGSVGDVDGTMGGDGTMLANSSSGDGDNQTPSVSSPGRTDGLSVNATGFRGNTQISFNINSPADSPIFGSPSSPPLAQVNANPNANPTANPTPNPTATGTATQQPASTATNWWTGRARKTPKLTKKHRRWAARLNEVAASTGVGQEMTEAQMISLLEDLDDDDDYSDDSTLKHTMTEVIRNHYNRKSVLKCISFMYTSRCISTHYGRHFCMNFRTSRLLCALR